MQNYLVLSDIKEPYATDLDFANIYGACDSGAFGKCYKHDGFLF